jgi:predicted phosphohydrolase
MRVYAIGDLHLGHAVEKPMDIFGPHWKDHAQQIATNWQERVGDQDMVLVPGDVSWAMRMGEAEEDLQWLDRLPGRKVLLKGNHDYWWPSISRLRDRLQGTSLFALQYDSISISGVWVGGTRLWTMPDLEIPYIDPLEVPPAQGQGAEAYDQDAPGMPHDEKIFRRELGRLKLSLASIDPEASLRIVMTHFPPTDEAGRDTALTRLLEKVRADIAVFGHLHNLDLPRGKTWDFMKNGVRYVLASCDAVDFAPYFLAEIPETPTPGF